MASFGDLSRIRTNIGAFSALDTMNMINKALAKAQLQLATGKRINSAGDDPAGFAIAKEMEGKALRYGQALKNIGDGQNLLTTAETGMVAIKDILVQMSVKTIQAASDTLAEGDRNKIKAELVQLTEEIDDIVAQTQWRDTKLLNGGTDGIVKLWVGPEKEIDDNQMTMTISAGAYNSSTLGVDIQDVGAKDVVLAAGSTTNGLSSLSTASVLLNYAEFGGGTYRIRVTRTAGDSVTVKMYDSSNNAVEIDSDNNITTNGLSTVMKFDATATEDIALNLGRGIAFSALDADFPGPSDHEMSVVYTQAGHSVSSADNAATYLGDIKTAMTNMATYIGRVGAYEARLDIKEDSVAAHETDVWAAYSRIMDADMAKTQLSVTKFTILQQSAVAGLAQANIAPSFILGLLGG